MNRIIRKLLSYSDRPKSDNRIMLIPPTPLDGSFGDELMVVTFLEHFKDFEVDLYESRVNRRPDLFKPYRVNYIQWKKPIDWTKYIGAFILGADNMTGAYGTAAPIYKMSLLHIANTYSIPTKILGFSINENMNKEVKEAMQALLPKTRFFLREAVSYERAKDFLPGDCIKLVSDLAFLCPAHDTVDKEYSKWINQQKNDQRILFALCPNAIQADKVGLANYLEGLKSIIEYASMDHKLSCVLLYHDVRKHCENKYSDKDLARMLYDKLQQTLPCFTNLNIENGVKLKSYLKDIDFTLTGRMHFGISGYSLKKPMLGLAYEGKFSGLQTLFGLDPAKTLINDLHNLTAYSQLTSDFISNLEVNRKSVENHYSEVIGYSKSNFE